MFALKSLFVAAGLALSLVGGVQTQQLPLGNAKYAPYDAGLFTPVEDLGVLSVTEFTTLAHPAFPKYNVRIKKSDFCDGTVRYVVWFLQCVSLHAMLRIQIANGGRVRDFYSGLSQDTSTSRRGTCSSTSSRAGATPTKILSYSGRMVGLDVPPQ